ncbi:MAG: primase-helicase family protein, partial [Promethearchaeota archaeon]
EKYKSFETYKTERLDDEIIRIEFKNNPNVECPLNKGHCHSSNRQYILLNILTFQYKFKCYSGKCAGRQQHHYCDIRHKMEFDRDIVENYLPSKFKNAEVANSRLVRKYKNMTVEYINTFFVNITGLATELFLYISYGKNGQKNISRKNPKGIKEFILGVISVHSVVGPVVEDEKINKDNLVKYNVYDLWIRSKYRHDKKHITCMPNKDLIKHDEYNIFDKFNIDVEDCKKADNDISNFLNHIKNIYCKGNEEQYEYIINWIAFTLQKPEIKIGVAIVLISKPGAGKGIILQKIKDILGEKYFLACQDFTDVMGNFNGQIEGKFLTFLDECVWGGNKKGGEVGKLKTFITETERRINRKNVPAYMAPMYNNVIIATNEDWAVPAGKGQRRFFCLELDNKYCGNSNEAKKEYFKKIIDTCPKSLANYFYNLDISEFNPRCFPETETTKEQQTMNMNSVECFVEGYLKNEVEIVSLDTPEGCLIEPDDSKIKWIPRPDIYLAYKEYCNENKLYQDSSGKFWVMFKKILPWTKDKAYIKKIRGKYQLRFKDKSEMQQDWLSYMCCESWDF